MSTNATHSPGASEPDTQQAGVKRKRTEDSPVSCSSAASAPFAAPEDGSGHAGKKAAADPAGGKKAVAAAPVATAPEGAGGHVLGNFPRYYDFHPAAPRLQPLLSSQDALDAIFTPSVVAREELMMADLGCNDGTLTLLLQKELRGELQRRLGGVERGRVGVLGVDIDEELIDRARKQGQEGAGEGGVEMGPTRFEAADLGDEEDSDGMLDLVTIMSTTMWVHLNHGDQGLQRFLRRAAASGRAILIEPQDWSSYKSAQRRLKRLGLRESPYYQQIDRSVPPAVLIRRVLVDELGMRVVNLGKTSSWQRDLLLFYKPPNKE